VNGLVRSLMFGSDVRINMNFVTYQAASIACSEASQPSQLVDVAFNSSVSDVRCIREP